MIKIVDYREFLNVLENSSDVTLMDEPYIKELQQCRESHDVSCCGSASNKLKNCNLKLHAILDEAATNEHKLRDRIKCAFGGSDVEFHLSNKFIII